MIGFDFVFGGMVWKESLLFSLYKTNSCLGLHQPQRRRGDAEAGCLVCHVPSPSNEGETGSGGRKGFLTWGNPSQYPMAEPSQDQTVQALEKKSEKKTTCSTNSG